MDVLREQVQRLRPEEQERVFAMLLNDNVPFQDSQHSVVVLLSKASDACIKNIQSYLKDLQTTTGANVPKKPTIAGNPAHIVKDHSVHFDRDGVGDDSDGESPERKLSFSSTQAAVRKKIKSTQKRTVRLRKSSTKRDYGERLDTHNEVDEGQGDAEEDLDAALEGAVETIDLDLDDVAAGGEVDDSNGVDCTVEDDEVSGLDDDENQDAEDIKEDFVMATNVNATTFDFGSSTVEQRFLYYVPILSHQGFDFGRLAENGYPSPSQ